MISALVRNWWAFVARGVLAVLFGLYALLFPGVTMLSLVLLFAGYCIADGIFAIAGAVRAVKAGERWGLLILEGIVDLLAAAAAVLMPGLTVVLFVLLVAAWALVTGVLLLMTALKVDADHGRWWMALGALASLLYGALLVIAPLIGAVVLTWWIGAYAIIFGIALLTAAVRLRAKFKETPLAKLA
jgi:uncharacterized membrane protein HdeD (DUF308 family)